MTMSRLGPSLRNHGPEKGKGNEGNAKSRPLAATAKQSQEAG
jgi:hypothetical protein